MNNAGKGWTITLLLTVGLWLGGCATPTYQPTTVASSAGTVPRVDASALLAPRTPVTTPASAVQPAAVRDTLPASAAPAVLREPVADPAPRRRSSRKAKASRRATAKAKPAKRSTTRRATPPPADPEPATASPEPDTGKVGNGRYSWDDDGAGGPVKVVVNIAKQQAYVYRDDKLVGKSSVSTGRKGHRTPTGTFEILQKKRRHTSNIYKGAKMPYMQRLTWDGIAMHAGDLPGYPASHGCIRLPTGFAKKLFKATDHGTQVVVTKG